LLVRGWRRPAGGCGSDTNCLSRLCGAGGQAKQS
jgi:hypothetical protein